MKLEQLLFRDPTIRPQRRSHSRVWTTVTLLSALPSWVTQGWWLRLFAPRFPRVMYMKTILSPSGACEKENNPHAQNILSTRCTNLYSHFLSENHPLTRGSLETSRVVKVVVTKPSPFSPLSLPNLHILRKVQGTISINRDPISQHWSERKGSLQKWHEVKCLKKGGTCSEVGEQIRRSWSRKKQGHLKGKGLWNWSSENRGRVFPDAAGVGGRSRVVLHVILL